MEHDMQRITVTIDDELVEELDLFIESRGYQNRSEAMRDLVRAGLQRDQEDKQAAGDDSTACVAALVYVYDHHVRELAKRLAHTHHDHHDISIATMHMHLDHDNCMEVAMLRGRAADVRHFAEHVIAERGIRHGRLVTVPVELKAEKHTHGKHTHAHEHAHVKEVG
jgi:CopG family transcriptional regulator, nickel-responsive regulator